ncbi:MAG: hypothetical protein ACRC6V_01515 [Bacteroidales bacterium]
MSYCRWSSMDFKCDLYVYEAEGGIAIRVASNRVVGDVPSLDWPSAELLHSAYKTQMEFLGTVNRESINLQYGGKSWYGLSKDAACAVVDSLEQEGYMFPESLYHDILEVEFEIP